MVVKSIFQLKSGKSAYRLSDVIVWPHFRLADFAELWLRIPKKSIVTTLTDLSASAWASTIVIPLLYSLNFHSFHSFIFERFGIRSNHNRLINICIFPLYVLFQILLRHPRQHPAQHPRDARAPAHYRRASGRAIVGVVGRYPFRWRLQDTRVTRLPVIPRDRLSRIQCSQTNFNLPISHSHQLGTFFRSVKWFIHGTHRCTMDYAEESGGKAFKSKEKPHTRYIPRS